MLCYAMAYHVSVIVNVVNDMFMSMWVCLKIVYPIVPNGFADHYPYKMAISLGVYTIFRQTHIDH